jgi:hypothetical protein
MHNSRGSILAITVGFALVFTMLGTASIYMSTIQNDTQVNQVLKKKAFWLAEAGLAHASAELRKRIETDLKAAVENDNPNDVNTSILGYFNSQKPAGLLTDYGNLSFSGGKTVLNVAPAAPIDLGDGIRQGSYSATVTISLKSSPNPINTSSTTNTTAYTFSYIYSITSTAYIPPLTVTLSNNNERVKKIINLGNGSFSITVQRDNFAKYALFTNNHVSSSGDTVWFTANTTFNGPMHTNDRFSFANNPSGNFTELVTQHETTARFRNNGNPILRNAARNGNIDVPRFKNNDDNNFKRGQPEIIIPATTSQQYMKSKALGGSNPTTNGIYLPNDGTKVTGGIFIRGDATVNMAVTSQNPVYTITQGSTTRTITVNYSNKTTTMGTKVYSGIPDGQGQTGGGALVYSTGTISNFYGTVQKDSTVTVASENDLVITNNILYEKDPRVIGNENYDNLLGIISWNGDVRIGTSAPNNITIYGVVMAPNGVFTVDNYNNGSYRGVVTLLGGAITDSYGAFGTFNGDINVTGYGRNFIYDVRMSKGYLPLYFPFMPNFTTFTNGIGINLTWQEG